MKLYLNSCEPAEIRGIAHAVRCVFELGGATVSVLMQYADQLTVPGNHAGIPGISIPAGFDKDELPIGIQFLGSDLSEDILFRISRMYEKATENESWRSVKPPAIGG